MDLLELAEKVFLIPKRTSTTNGGEYHSACPRCQAGEDRFIIWPNIDRYWCRQCKITGDGIQFCRDFLAMSFHEARTHMGRSQHELRGCPSVVPKFKAAISPS